MKQWIVLMIAIVPLQAGAQENGSGMDPRYERYYAAYHDAAICDCAEPLLQYLYSMEGRLVGETPGTYQQGGRVWLATVMVLNERWGSDLGLVGENLDLLDLAMVDQLHDWIEEVQVYDGVRKRPSNLRKTLPRSREARIAPYLPSAKDRERSKRKKEILREREYTSSDSRSYIPRDFRILCDNCADPACDSQRIANTVAAQMCNGHFDLDCLTDSARLCDDRISMRTLFVLDVFDALFWADSHMSVDVRAKDWERAEDVALGDTRIVPTLFEPGFGRWAEIPGCYYDPTAAVLAPISTTHTDMERFSVTVIDPRTAAARTHTYYLSQPSPSTDFAYQECHTRYSGGSGNSGCNCTPGGPCGHGTIALP